jgi:hypothetical protein
VTPLSRRRRRRKRCRKGGRKGGGRDGKQWHGLARAPSPPKVSCTSGVGSTLSWISGRSHAELDKLWVPPGLMASSKPNEHMSYMSYFHYQKRRMRAICANDVAFRTIPLNCVAQELFTPFTYARRHLYATHYPARLPA